MDFNERVIPGVSSNFMFQEALARYEFAKKYLKPDSKVLDLGSGTGYGSKVLTQKNCSVLGIDINSEAISFAKKRYSDKNINFQKGDITKLRFKNRFDAVVSFEVIEHLANPLKYLDGINKALKTGGTFILSTPNASVISPKGGVSSPYHVKEFDHAELKSLLTKKFKKVEIFGQTKSKKAKEAWKDFMKSQEAREGIARNDKLGIRKFIPKELKEKFWKYFGSFFGRKTQEELETKDFPIGSESVRLAYYFVAVCRK